MSIIAPPQRDALRQRLTEIRPQMVQARLDLRIGIARALQRAIAIVGWTDKEAAARIWPDRDIEAAQAQLSKWLRAAERPHFDAVLDVPELQWPLIESLALLANDACEVSTRIERRIA